jgi:Na+/melibiose symporter-like transporter
MVNFTFTNLTFLLGVCLPINLHVPALTRQAHDRAQCLTWRFMHVVLYMLFDR